MKSSITAPETAHRNRELRAPIADDDQSTAAVELGCPGCYSRVHLEPSELVVGRRVGCLSCGWESWLDRDDGPEGPGPWMLLPEWPDI